MTDVFDDATSITIGNKEVKSIKVGEATIYEKGGEPLPDDLTLTVEVTEHMITSLDGEVYFGLSDVLATSTGECDIDWGDDSQLEHFVLDGENQIKHNYSEEGTYTITVYGEVTSIGGGVLTQPLTAFIPSSVTSLANVNNDTFNNLEELTFESSTPPTADASWGDGFGIVPCLIRVPRGSLSAYQNASNYPSSMVSTIVEY